MAVRATETITFDMYLMGDKIGYMKLAKELKSDGSELYTMETYGRAKVLWIDRENRTNFQVVYKAGKLISSHGRLKMARLKPILLSA